jgi:hypothetical protein
MHNEAVSGATCIFGEKHQGEAEPIDLRLSYFSALWISAVFISSVA